MRRIRLGRARGFSILEALITVAIAAMLIVALVMQTGTNFRFFAQSDDTLASARAAQLLLAYLKADVALADAKAQGDITVSPETGSVYPKNWMHLAHDPLGNQLTLFAYTIGQAPAPVPAGDPIASKPTTHPLTRLALARAAHVQNAMTWVDSGAPNDPKRARHFVVNVRAGAIVQRVTYSYLPDEKVVVRQGPEGTVKFGAGSVSDFSATPYLEFLVPRPPDQPLELLKCWVEIHIDVQAAQKADPISKRAVVVHTKLFPKHLTSVVRGLSPF